MMKDSKTQKGKPKFSPHTRFGLECVVEVFQGMNISRQDVTTKQNWNSTPFAHTNIDSLNCVCRPKYCPESQAHAM